MQSLALALVVFAAPSMLLAQNAPGAQLWRLVTGTMPLPPALATGGTGGLWNPAQPDGPGTLALELIQTPATLSVSGFLGGASFPAGKVGQVGVVYGRMSMRDLVRTTLSPDPDGDPIQYYTQTARIHWSHERAGSTFGSAIAFHEGRLDDRSANHWTFDIGGRHRFGNWLVLAAATHFFSHFESDASQDVYGGLELRLWRGELWSGSGLATVQARYGIAALNGRHADHQLGAGLEVGGVFAADLVIARDGGYDGPAWRPIAGVHIRIGRYQILFAGDAGPRQIGAAYRVGLEARAR